MNIFQQLSNNLVRPFIDLAAAPRAIWYIIGAFVLDTAAYYGMLLLMIPYLSQDLHWSDTYAGFGVSFFTMLITLGMLGIGSFAESFGLRRAILGGLLIAIFGRALYCLAPAAAGIAVPACIMIASIIIMSVGSGLLQPICYSGVKQFTDEKTSSMGYAVIYALMNLGLVGMGALSSWIRPAVQKIIDHPKSGAENGDFLKPLAEFSGSGIQAVNWLCLAITVVAFVLTLMLFTRRQEVTRLRSEMDHADPNMRQLPWDERLRLYFTDGPFSNIRFVFFIFMLLPMRTMFAHQWLTMPQYILRAYPQEVSDNMEIYVNWINALIIFIGVPLITAMTRRANVYTMMILGSLFSAAPTFLLCYGPNLPMLITYFVIFSIGEAMWSARFLEYASELAPPGRVAQYMGLASIPWLLAKGITGLYSGVMLSKYCPADTPPDQMHTAMLWVIYGCIAMTTPLGLCLARKWVMSGLQTSKLASEPNATVSMSMESE